MFIVCTKSQPSSPNLRCRRWALGYAKPLEPFQCNSSMVKAMAAQVVPLQSRPLREKAKASSQARNLSWRGLRWVESLCRDEKQEHVDRIAILDGWRFLLQVGMGKCRSFEKMLFRMSSEIFGAWDVGVKGQCAVTRGHWIRQQMQMDANALVAKTDQTCLFFYFQ